LLFLNGRAIISFPISTEGPEEIGIQDNTLMYARLTGKKAKTLSPEMFLTKDLLGTLKSSVRSVNIQAPVVAYFWYLN